MMFPIVFWRWSDQYISYDLQETQDNFGVYKFHLLFVPRDVFKMDLTLPYGIVLKCHSARVPENVAALEMSCIVKYYIIMYSSASVPPARIIVLVERH